MFRFQTQTARRFDHAPSASGLPRLAEMQFFHLKFPGTGRSAPRLRIPGCYSRRAVAKRFPGYSQRRFCILIHKVRLPLDRFPNPSEIKNSPKSCR
jgi:hypothetical protein